MNSQITYLLDKYILPNTFYHEGENGECGETPPMAASAIQDMMLMSDRGEIWVSKLESTQFVSYSICVVLTAFSRSFPDWMTIP
jgi:hypothetical protein